MSALSFGEEWLELLLSGYKKQTTRPKTKRINEGDEVVVYNQQRRCIIDKPLRIMTHTGYDVMCKRGYPDVSGRKSYHAHLLGKVLITEVYDTKIDDDPDQWANDDGFYDFAYADTWFRDHHGDGWREMTWTIIKWVCWTERYFEPMSYSEE